MNYYHIKLTPRVSTFSYFIEAETEDEARQEAQELADYDYDESHSFENDENFYNVEVKKISAETAPLEDSDYLKNIKRNQAEYRAILKKRADEAATRAKSSKKTGYDYIR